MAEPLSHRLRWPAYSAFTLGWILVFSSILLTLYVAPRLERASYNVNRQMMFNGIGSYFAPSAERVIGPTRLRQVVVQRGDSRRSTFGTAVVDVASATTDPRSTTVVELKRDVVALDRRTGSAVACCGGTAVGGSLTLRFPYRTQRRDYLLWDWTARVAAPAVFSGLAKVMGVITYRFESSVPSTELGTIELPVFLFGESGARIVVADRRYLAMTTLWVEPRTGIIVRMRRVSIQVAQDPSAEPSGNVVTLFRATLLEDEASVARAIVESQHELQRGQLVARWLPLAGLVVGFPLILVGYRTLGALRR